MSRGEKSNKGMGIRNIGPKTEGWLREVGIHGYEDLAKWGSVEVYRRLKERRAEKISLNALYALEAALWDLHWLELPQDIKEKVKREAAEA